MKGLTLSAFPSEEEHVTKNTFRHVVGHLTSGVTVVTCVNEDRPFGATVSSVTSLSMDPPLMLVCLNKEIPTSDAISKAGYFGINILGLGQEGLATQFAAPSENKFKGVAISIGTSGIPMIDNAHAQLECRVVEQVQGGSHIIFIGRVLEAKASEGEPLTYYRGGFGRFHFVRDDEIYQMIRTSFLKHPLPEGSVITIDELATNFGVDRSAVFYALTRIATDGLIRRDPERGYVVTSFQVRSADEAFEARAIVELGVIDLLFRSTDLMDLSEVRESFSEMDEMLRGNRFVDFKRYLESNNTFHERIVALARNTALSGIFRQLSLRSIMNQSFGSTSVTSQEFIETQRNLLRSLEKADPKAAQEAILAYTDIAKKRVHEILEEIPFTEFSAS